MPLLLRLASTAVCLLALTATAAVAQDDGGDGDDGHALRGEVASTEPARPDLRVHGGGWGHGAGMSQYGAWEMSRQGLVAAEILTHYHRGTAVAPLLASDFETLRVATQAAADDTHLVAGSADLTWLTCGEPAVTQHVRDDDCGEAAGHDELTQPAGERWDVTPTADGFELDGEGAPEEAVATTRLRIDHDGETIEAPRYTGADGSYRWGKRDLVLDAREAGDDGGDGSGSGGSGSDGDEDPDAEPADGDVPVVHAVQELSMERYLRGIGEMPSSWGDSGGEQALQAQAIAARSYAQTRRDGQSAGGDRSDASGDGPCSCHLLASPHDQAYVGYGKELGSGANWVAAVEDTERLVVVRDGEAVRTFYSSSHGGRSENLEDSWAFANTTDPSREWHRSEDDPYSLMEHNPYRSWVAEAGQAELAGIAGDVEIVTRVRVTERTDGGSPRTLVVTGIDADGQDTEAEVTGASGLAGAALRSALRLDAVTDADGGDASPATFGRRLPSTQVSRLGFERFTDDDANVHEYGIEAVAAAGIASGVSDDRFAPRRGVSRAQMATFLYQTFDIEEADPEQDGFDDVEEDSTHATAIASVAEAGIAAGYDDGTYRPGETVTRAQMATFLAQALGLDEVDPDGRYDDVGEGHTHGGTIHAIADAGITGGCDASSYCPGGTVTRAQMATFLHTVVRNER